MPSEAAPIITEATSNKSKTLLVVNNHKFHFRKILSTGACNHRNCKSYFCTSGESPRTLIHEYSDFIHNHDQVNNRNLQSYKAKRKAVDEPCEKPSKIIHASVEKFENCSLRIFLTSNKLCIGRVEKNCLHFLKI